MEEKFTDMTDIKVIYKMFKSDKIKNANIIIDLLKELEGDQHKKIKKSITVIHKIFCQLIKDGDIKYITISEEDLNSKEKYDKWLYERYLEIHEQLLKIVTNEQLPLSIRELALLLIIKLIQKEALYPVTNEKVHNLSFPFERLKALYQSLLFVQERVTNIIRKIKDFLEMPDFLFASLFVLSQIVPRCKQKALNENYIDNLISILELVRLPEDGKCSSSKYQLFASEGKDEEESTDKAFFDFPYKFACNYFNIIWDAVLKYDFNSTTYKRCLVLIPEKVLKHLDQPVQLTDFFINAYNMGGVISLLAMHGVYILITQYNLEYPDFYDKLYALFQSSIFHAKYKPRFFMLCNKFFMSPYLPEYIVAAFIKRCSRLMLTAPSSSLILLLRFVVNLLLRFPSLKRMIHQPDAQSLNTDPFLPEEPKPLNCRAGESSLWEVATLREHPLCGVSKAANFITRNLPDVEHDLSRFVEDTYQDLYAKACKIKEPRIATTFYKPSGLFHYSDDTMSSTWSVI